MPQGIKVYGTTWCGDCHRSKRLLDKHGVAYEWIDIQNDPDAAKRVRQVNKGMMSVPTIVFPDGSVLVEPSDTQLSRKLGLLAA